MHADRVQAIPRDPLEERRAIAHEPDHQLPLRRHPRIHRGVLHVLRFAALLEHEIDLRMLARAGVDLAGPRGELVALRLGIFIGERSFGGAGEWR